MSFANENEMKNVIGKKSKSVTFSNAESRRIEYNDTDTTQDEIQRQLGYRPEGRLPDLGAVKENTRLDRDNMDYKRPLKEGEKNRWEEDYWPPTPEHVKKKQEQILEDKQKEIEQRQMEGVNAMTNRNRYTSVDSVDNIYIRNSSEIPSDKQASNPNHVKQATSSNLIQMEFSKPEEYNPSDKSFYNYRKTDKNYRRRYSPPPIYEDSRQQAYRHRTEYKYQENKYNRSKNYYYDSYGYKHYYSDESRRHYNSEKSRQRYFEQQKEEERRKKAAELEKKRRKEYLKNICCLFPCCCCCYCRCQKFPKEEEMSDTSDTDVS